MEKPNSSIAGQIISLYDQGYAAALIVKELSHLHVTIDRVRRTIRASTNSSMDSRRLFEVWEANIEMLALLRELVATKRQASAASRMRNIEKRDLPAKLGNALTR